MAEQQAFKDQLHAARVRKIGKALADANPGFDGKAFARSASQGLEELELKARVKHIIAALHVHLPGDYGAALEVLLRAGRASLQQGEGAVIRGFAAWPLIDYIGEHGLGDPARSLDALRELTALFSAEFAIRPFLLADSKGTLKRVMAWTRDERDDVRRLCSEGIRPRLPWGVRLDAFIEDPSPVLRVLEKLKDDPSEYVRRSVANNLNDVSKDHPERVVEVCGKWMQRASEERKWIVRHGTRSLVKAGQPDALALLGFDPGARVDVEGLVLKPKRLRVGDDLRFEFRLRSRAKKPEPLVVDYVVHHVKKGGHTTPKVFKLKQLTLAAGGEQTVQKVHKLRTISTRVYHPGKHSVEIQVNGKARARADFELRV